MKKARFWLRLVLAFLKKFRKVIILTALAGFLIFLSLSWIYPKLPKAKKTQIIGITGRFQTDTLPLNILNLVSDGLTKTLPSGEVEPSLAKSWITADSGATWIFSLDTTRVWQDGTKIKAGDFKYNFSDVKVEVENDSTLVFKLNEPFSSFPSAVSKPVFKKGLLGTGNFKVSRISFQGSVIDKLYLEGKDENRIIKFYPNEDAAKTAIKLGSIETLEETLDKAEFSHFKNLTVSESVNKQRYVAIFFNYEDPILGAQGKEIRQALSYAINKEKLGGERALSPISPSSWAFNPQVKPYTYDKARAKELLKELSQEQRENLNLKLVTIPTLLNTAESIASNWQEVGVKTQVLVVAALPQDFQAFLAIQEIPNDPDQYSLWHSTQINSGVNITKYRNLRIDKLLEDGRKTLETEKRRQIYLDFQRFLLEDAPVAFLYHPTSYEISRK